MSISMTRRGLTVLVAVTALCVSALAAASQAQAATLYACVSKNGTAHVFTKKPKCKKGEKALSWGTVGPAGKNGTNGANGANGTNGTNGKDGKAGPEGPEGVPGQPQEVTKFAASLTTSSPPATLFSADGITYTFSCNFVLFFNAGVVDASGAAGQSYGLANFGRPTGQETKSEDLKSLILVESLGKSAKAIADTVNASENGAKSIEQYGIWTVTVEGPTSVTLLHMWMETGAACGIHGTALTIPD